MLCPCTKNEFEQYSDLAYEIAMDLTKSGYPTYRDGIKTKAMFVERSMEAFGCQTEQMLIFECEGEVRGLIHWYWIPEDRYLQTVSFNISKGTEQALAEFLAYTEKRFHGYDLFMGFPAENTEAVRYLAAQGAECIESDYNNTAFPDRLGEIPVSNSLIRIGKENFDSFRKLHEQIEDDMYWDSDRILRSLDDWVIFVRELDGKQQGAVYYKSVHDGWYEIFGVDMDGGKYEPEAFRELLNAALLDVKQKNGKAMTFFCEKEYEETAVDCGFICIGSYLCYKIHLG